MSDDSPENTRGGADTMTDPYGPEGTYVVIDLPGGGFGSISLRARLETVAITEHDVDALIRQVIAGEYSKHLDDYSLTQCGDGRDGEPVNEGGKIFGGTAGYTKSLRIAGVKGSAETAEDDIRQNVIDRTNSGRRSGGHKADTHGNELACGCGECDGAKAAAEIVRDETETVSGLVMSLLAAIEFDGRHGFDSVENDQLLQEVIVEYINLLVNRYFDNGVKQIEAIEEATDPSTTTVENLEGEHEEVLWVINLRSDTTENRTGLVGENKSKHLMSFWEDQWQIENELRLDTETDTDFRKAVVADLTRRVATAMNLTAADLKLVILK